MTPEDRAYAREMVDAVVDGPAAPVRVALPAEPSQSRRTSWTAADLLTAEFPAPRWAVPGILGEGLNLLGGPPKVGKSWLALDLALAVATGGLALGSVPVEQGEVLYLALEDPARRMQQRLRVILADRSVPVGLDGFVVETTWETISDGGLDHLDAWLTEHHGCRLVVVDVLARVRGPVTSTANQYAADYAAISSLKLIADRHGVAFLVVHHTRKSAADDFVDEISGTHGLAGASDTVLKLRRARGSADAVLQVTGRDVAEAEHALRLDASNGTCRLLAGPAADYDLGDTRRRIVSLLRDSGGSLTPKVIAERLGLEAATARQTVRRMSLDGQLTTDGSGRYTAPPVFPVTPVTVSLPLGDTSDSSHQSDTSDMGDRDIEGGSW
ncbi:MAG: AAA family ATPase [Euzebyaceae bacterium]|nr:AAA family ATPase [Euzebyaceae bacterium]